MDGEDAADLADGAEPRLDDIIPREDPDDEDVVDEIERDSDRRRFVDTFAEMRDFIQEQCYDSCAYKDNEGFKKVLNLGDILDKLRPEAFPLFWKVMEDQEGIVRCLEIPILEAGPLCNGDLRKWIRKDQFLEAVDLYFHGDPN
jgi:hypothetical protein